MNIKRLIKTVFLLTCAVLFLTAGIHCSYAAEWKTITSSGIMLDYHPDDEEIAVKLLPELVYLVEDLKEFADTKQLEDETSKIESKKAECLNFIAAKVGLDKPGEMMKEVFDSFLLCQKNGIAEIKDISRFRLWRKDRLVESLKSGVRVRGFAYNRAKDDIAFAMSVSYNPNASGMFYDDKKLPLVIEKGDSVSEIIDKARSAINDFRYYAKQMVLSAVIFHETAEAGIVSDFGLRTPFRRWFCDGVAQWVSEMATKEFIGQSAYEQIVNAFSTKNYESEKSKVDLIGWRAAEWEGSMPKCPGLTHTSAHYTFAVKEIRGLAERHGSDVIARIIKHLSKLEAENRDSAAILDAIQSVTKEDIRATLSQYGKEAQDDFRGLCVMDFKLKYIDTDSRTQRELKAGDKIILDGKHDIGLEFKYAVLDKPVDIRLELGDAWNSSTKQGSKKRARLSATAGIAKHPGNFKAGSYMVRVLFNGKVFREVPVTLVNP